MTTAMNSRRSNVVPFARSAAIVRQEAADWFVANEGGLDDAQRSQFAHWLKASPAHVREYLAIAQVARDLPGVIDSGASREVARRFRLPAALAAALGVLALGLLLWNSGRMTPTATEVLRFATAHGEQATRQLADGSVLVLNTDSLVEVRYSGAERRVAIERGQVMFDVTRDPRRPFHVSAGAAEVMVVGTKFDVYLQPDSTLVTVVEGRVRVGTGASPEGSVAVVLGAGEQVRVREGDAVLLPARVDAAQATAWMRRQLVFAQQPLAAVVEEFNRYTDTPIVIGTPRLARTTITGSFSIDDVESFLAYLRSRDGVRVEITPTRILVTQN